MKPAANYKTALLGGLTVGLAPAWIISFIVSVFPSLEPQELGAVAEFMSNGMGATQVLFLMITVLLVPPLEELIFRGWLWKLVGWKLSPYWTWVAISIIFAVVHMEPIHVLGLLPFSFFTGWLRLETGKLGPSVVAHIANNAAACMLMVA